MSVASSYYNETQFPLLGSQPGHVCIMYSIRQAGKWDLLHVCACLSSWHMCSVDSNRSHEEWTLSDMVLETVLPRTYMPMVCLTGSKRKTHGQSEQTDKKLCNRKEESKCVGLPAVFALFWTTSEKSLFSDFALTVVQHTWCQLSTSLKWLSVCT